MKNPDPGYLLPIGEAYTDDFVCQLIYIPRKDEYYRAMLGALLYMGTWVAWERDDAKRGKDAAQAWQEANELTMECWRMTNCLDDITQRMDEIILLMGLKKDCCDNNITYGPGTEVETEIQPDVGDAPDYYGETVVTDWDDWREHVCHNAHLYVDKLVWQAGEMDDLLQLGGVTIGATGAGLLLLGAVGLLIAVPYAVVAATAAGILAAGTLAVFLTTADDIEAAREDIVCAFIEGQSVADVVEAALGSASLDWLLFFQWVSYDSATAIIYEGGYDSEYLPPDTRDDCIDCGPEQYGASDLYLETVYGGVPQYDEGEMEWTVGSQAMFGCEGIDIYVWEDDTRTVKKTVRFVVSECTGWAGNCASIPHSNGWLDTASLWTFDHPRLAGFSDAKIDRYRETHTYTGSKAYLTFKLYA